MAAEQKAVESTVKEEASTTTDHAGLSLKTEREEASATAKGNLSETMVKEEDSATPAERATTERTSTISVTKRRAESTR